MACFLYSLPHIIHFYAGTHKHLVGTYYLSNLLLIEFLIFQLTAIIVETKEIKRSLLNSVYICISLRKLALK